MGEREAEDEFAGYGVRTDYSELTL